MSSPSFSAPPSSVHPFPSPTIPFLPPSFPSGLPLPPHLINLNVPTLTSNATHGHPSNFPMELTITSGENTFVGVANPTLYIQNLNEKARIKDLKNDLKRLFSPFGHIHNVIAKKSVKMRGQAFIIFDLTEQASKALHSLQGAVLYHKPMVIKYAKFKSDIISQREGILEQEKLKRKADLEERLNHPKLTRRQLMQQLLATQAMHGVHINPALPVSTSDLGLPNKILFVQNLPVDTIEEDLIKLFSHYQGFKEVRSVSTKKDIAFVEYDSEMFANTARIALDRYKIIPNHEIRVVFAKK